MGLWIAESERLPGKSSASRLSGKLKGLNGCPRSPAHEPLSAMNAASTLGIPARQLAKALPFFPVLLLRCSIGRTSIGVGS
jgi:hypothetical protein